MGDTAEVAKGSVGKDIKVSSYSHAFCVSRAEIRSALPDSDDLTKDECRQIIRRYAAGVGGNFVTWLAAGVVSCRSIEGRYAASENVHIEIRDNHPAMLRRFAEGSGAVPSADDYRFAELAALPVQTEVSNMSGLFMIALVGTLENISLDYIPWLGAISRRLGNTDMEYVDIHGEADIAHADQFCWALEKEAAQYDAPDAIIAAGSSAAVNFIKSLLQRFP